MRIFAVMLLGIMVVGCTDTDRASIGAYGTPGHITCFTTDGHPFLDEDSSGRIQTVNHSDGWEFKSAKDGKFVRVSGACMIRN